MKKILLLSPLAAGLPQNLMENLSGRLTEVAIDDIDSIAEFQKHWSVDDSIHLVMENFRRRIKSEDYTSLLKAEESKKFRQDLLRKVAISGAAGVVTAALIEEMGHQSQS